ncbi:MAG TPA: DUF4160 domain-containing protein [Iamia sp.]|nr:DUF4160 domain-containing protein [Iamia sp.]
MSRYEGNPLWNQRSGQPFTIISPAAWDEAIVSGHLTAEHVLERLGNAIDFELGQGSDAGFNSEGFLDALVADSTRHEGGISVVLHPNDHPPPHVHIKFRSDPSLRLRMAIETGELLDEVPAGWTRRLRKAAEIVRDESDLLMKRWMEMQDASPPHA